MIPEPEPWKLKDTLWIIAILALLLGVYQYKSKIIRIPSHPVPVEATPVPLEKWWPTAHDISIPADTTPKATTSDMKIKIVDKVDWITHFDSSKPNEDHNRHWLTAIVTAKDGSTCFLNKDDVDLSPHAGEYYDCRWQQ